METVQARDSLNIVTSPSLQTLLQPLSADRFFAEYWQRQFAFIPGTRGKFADLLPWPVLNRILAEHRIDAPRLRLVRNGMMVSTHLYTEYQPMRHYDHDGTTRRRVEVPRIVHKQFIGLLRGGATLVIDAADELYAPLGLLTAELENVFEESVNANLYAGWTTTNGFSLHWDDHDVIVAQITGRKKWSVYGVTRRYPLHGESRSEPPQQPLWEGILEDGDLLYIPRGWWHIAHAIDEPSLHLTFSIENRNGTHLLSWVLNNLKRHEVVRKDLPRFADKSTQAAHASMLRDAVLADLDDDVISRFLGVCNATARSRPAFSLPYGPTDNNSLPHDLLVRLVAPRGAQLNKVAEGCEVVLQGKRLTVSEAARPIMETLCTGCPVPVGHLCTLLDPRCDEAVFGLLLDLIAEGTVATVESANRSELP